MIIPGSSHFAKQFKPEQGFITFLDDNSQFGDEFAASARAPNGTIVGCDGGSGPQQLTGEMPPFPGAAKGPGVANDRLGKRHRSVKNALGLDGWHPMNLASWGVSIVTTLTQGASN